MRTLFSSTTDFRSIQDINTYYYLCIYMCDSRWCEMCTTKKKKGTVQLYGHTHDLHGNFHATLCTMELISINKTNSSAGWANRKVQITKNTYLYVCMYAVLEQKDNNMSAWDACRANVLRWQLAVVSAACSTRVCMYVCAYIYMTATVYGKCYKPLSPVVSSLIDCTAKQNNLILKNTAARCSNLIANDSYKYL